MVQDRELKSILDKLAESLINVYRDKLKSVILYGSFARGTAAPESDIDVLVLVDSPLEELKNIKISYVMFRQILHCNILGFFLSLM